MVKINLVVIWQVEQREEGQQRGLEAVALVYISTSLNMNMNAGSGPKEQKGRNGNRRNCERNMDGV